MKNRMIATLLVLAFVFLAGCSTNTADNDTSSATEATSSSPAAAAFEESARSEEPEKADTEPGTDKPDLELPVIYPGETATEKSAYTDSNSDTVVIPAQFTVSSKEDEQMIRSGLVIIGPDGSEFVWVPATVRAGEITPTILFPKVQEAT